ncbi:S-methyl-5-thioribose kinase [Bacillus sp. M6-12]|uniref:S-methyl-5-thioribose kinase n=1 Tax=Bacillus sp. M6-12 TaxID=2054166 RepID=UPI000C773BD7|nr:S-methyl-5-thioribose kinase [Bacillus sp. M6-12]PLS18510.1 S-methyl-5-thioribose kinase [Bacillus sp. M6-12]
MARFDRYFLMEPKDAIEYIREKMPAFEKEHNVTCTEIGDGNLNYVFRLVNLNAGTSIIVKQAGETARISDEFRLSTNRICIESNVLRLQGRLAPGLVPKVYLYDDKMNTCIMEDLSDHVILRSALLTRKIFPGLADHLSTFLVQTLLMTSDIVMNHKDKKEQVKAYINPELCEITEDLVYSEPFNDYYSRNELLPENKAWIEENIYNDKGLRLEAAKLKIDYMTNAQALLHGDLHTGSVFVRENSTKVIDPEFAFYGPMGYDIGNIIANLIFAWTNAKVTMPAGDLKNSFTDWMEETIIQVLDLFSAKFLAAWGNNATEVMAKEEGLDRWFLAAVLKDTAGIAGLELIRRIVGIAKVRDITSIDHKEHRIKAERFCLQTAKLFIINRQNYKCGRDFVQTMKYQFKNLGPETS